MELHKREINNIERLWYSNYVGEYKLPSFWYIIYQRDGRMDISQGGTFKVFKSYDIEEIKRYINGINWDND